MGLLIRGARVIYPGCCFDTVSDILCEYGMISRIGNFGGVPAGHDILDANGLVAAPGLVDMHCHLRDPGQEYKEDILTGTMSAAAGGITSVACMPNTEPVCDSAEIVRYMIEKAEKQSSIRVFPVGAVTVGLRGERPAPLGELRAAGAVAFSDDGRPVTDDETMLDAMLRAAELGTVVISHCEDLAFSGGKAIPAASLGLENCGAVIETAEDSMVARDILLSIRTGAPVHIAHVSTRNSIELIRYAKAMGAPVTCETCPHYFFLTSDIIPEKGALVKMNPPLRSESDLRAVIEGIVDGTIDAIATDHAPHSAEEKALPFDEAPNGVIGFETLLAVSLTALYHSGLMRLSDLLRLLTSSPAGILRIDAGHIRAGRRADIVLFSPDEEWTADPAGFLSKGKNSPFGGMKLKGKVKYTVSSGKIVYASGPYQKAAGRRNEHVY